MSDDQPDGCQPLAQLSLEHKPIFDAALRQLAQPISDYTFTNIFVWNGALHLQWTLLNSHLCVFANSTGDLTLLLPPIPMAGVHTTDADLRAALIAAFDVMDHYQRSHGVSPSHSRIEYVSDEMLERINTVSGGELPLSASPMSGDYLYPTINMIELPGKSLKSKRHSCNQFLRDYPDHHVESMQAHHLPDCVALLEDWREHADGTHEGQITEDESHVATALLRNRESQACRRALESHAVLGMKGLVVYVGDQLAGFTLGEALSPSQASILFEKTRPEYHGIPQFIFSQFCRHCWSDFPEINVGDDWGIPSLRWTKESYRPTRRLSKYVLARPVPMPIVLQTSTKVSASRITECRVAIADAVLPALPSAEWNRNPHPRPHPHPHPHPHVIRPATTADVSAILEIEHCSFDASNAFKRRQVRDLIANAHALCRVIEWDGQAAGWCVGLIRHHAHHRSGRIYGLAVHPDFRGRQAGTMLLLRILGELHDRQVRDCYLEVNASNASAIALYEKLGFRFTRLLPDYYAQGEAGLSMKRTINALAATR